MIITNSILCSNCNEIIDWYYLVPQHITSKSIDVNVIPKNRAKIYSCTYIENNTYELTCRCKKCYHSNVFQYETEINLELN